MGRRGRGGRGGRGGGGGVLRRLLWGGGLLVERLGLGGGLELLLLLLLESCGLDGDACLFVCCWGGGVFWGGVSVKGEGREGSERARERGGRGGAARRGLVVLFLPSRPPPAPVKRRPPRWRIKCVVRAVSSPGGVGGARGGRFRRVLSAREGERRAYTGRPGISTRPKGHPTAPPRPSQPAGAVGADPTQVPTERERSGGLTAPSVRFCLEQQTNVGLARLSRPCLISGSGLPSSSLLSSSSLSHLLRRRRLRASQHAVDIQLAEGPAVFVFFSGEERRRRGETGLLPSFLGKEPFGFPAHAKGEAEGQASRTHLRRAGSAPSAAPLPPSTARRAIGFSSVERTARVAMVLACEEKGLLCFAFGVEGWRRAR